MRIVLITMLALLAAGCGGPFRPPEFDRVATLGSDHAGCITTIHGTWPNLPDNPFEWFSGGRSPLEITIHTPGRQGTYSADQLSVRYTWSPKTSYSIAGLSGQVSFKESELAINLAQTNNGSVKPLAANGTYQLVGRPGCP